MNFKMLLLASASAAVLMACAPAQKGRSLTKINDIAHTESASIVAYGAEHATILGIAFLKADGRCSEVDFFKFVSTKYAEADDIINVRMEETSSKSGMEVTYSCKYSGLAVAYTPMSVEEAAAWAEADEAGAVMQIDLTTSNGGSGNGAGCCTMCMQPCQQ